MDQAATLYVFEENRSVWTEIEIWSQHLVMMEYSRRWPKASDGLEHENRRANRVLFSHGSGFFLASVTCKMCDKSESQATA